MGGGIDICVCLYIHKIDLEGYTGNCIILIFPRGELGGGDTGGREISHYIIFLYLWNVDFWKKITCLN